MTATSLDIALPVRQQGGYSARVLAHSVSPAGREIHTTEATFPRSFLAEFNTHRTLSKNAGSSRAIPVVRQIRKIIEAPFVPDAFGVNEPGMQANAFLRGNDHDDAVEAWLRGRDRAVRTALELILGYNEATAAFPAGAHLGDPSTVDRLLNALEEYVWVLRNDPAEMGRYLNVHKQTANRVLEPYAWITLVVTGTEWSNFRALRISPDAQPEICTIATLMAEAQDASTPTEIDFGQWHLPLIQADELDLVAADPERWRRIAVGRIARTSFETHAGVRDTGADVSLTERLLQSGHMSPTEQVATPLHDPDEWLGNFRGWKQWRKTLPNEDDFAKALAARA